MFRIAAVVFALLAVSHPIIGIITDLGAYAGPDAVGVDIDAATGQVLSVTPKSNAAEAGLLQGDRVDFTRAGSLMHLWLWDSYFPVGKPFALPILRNGSANTVTIVPAAPPIDTGQMTYDAIALIVALVLMTLSCAAVFSRVNALTLAFFAYCFFMAAGDNTAWLRISPPSLTPLAALESALPVGAGIIGFLFLCLRFPDGYAIGPWRLVDRGVIPFGLVMTIGYYMHFFEAAYWVGNAGLVYEIFGVLTLISVIIGFSGFVSRFRGVLGPDLTRMRWVAAAVFLYFIGFLLFFIDQSTSRSGHAIFNWFLKFNPAPYAFAYALVQGRIVDIRVVGGRAVIYALVTSIPVALLSFADWLFARRLEDARLATVFEVAIALGFSFWLRALHRRIDRFAERVFFATRHRSFIRVHHLTQALPFSEKVGTIETLLSEEAALAMGFTSAAVFRADDGQYARTVSVGWDGAAESLDADDPIVLFARSEHHGVHLTDTPHSRARLPHGEAQPVYALPVVVGRRVIAVVLYGGHRDGEVIDGEEEQLLSGLAHAAATAYEHLHAIEREREVLALRRRLSEFGVPT